MGRAPYDTRRMQVSPLTLPDLNLRPGAVNDRPLTTEEIASDKMVRAAELRKEVQDIKDSGERRTFDTGAQRDRGKTVKGRPDLIPVHPLQRVAVHFEKGAAKYKPRNWEQGMPLSEYYNSAMRHAWKAAAGFTDEDHEAAWLWNVMCFMETKERIARGLLPATLNDMPTTFAGQEPGF